VLTSIGIEDGFVGKLVAQGYSTTVCKIGGAGVFTLDDFRTILSFDTSSLRTLTNISRAVLTITRQSLTGIVSPLIVDIKAGTFGTTTTLAQMSYYATPSQAGIGFINVPTSDGSSTSFQIPASALKYIIGNVARTQIMLRQNLMTSTPSANPSILQIYDGQATLTIYV